LAKGGQGTLFFLSIAGSPGNKEVNVLCLGAALKPKKDLFPDIE
jgi:hypothetical protein